MKKLMFVFLALVLFSSISWAKEDWRVRLEQAKVYFDLAQYEKSKAILLKLVQTYPKEVEINYYLGLCQLALNDLPEAKKWLERAKELAPDDILIRLNLAWVLINLNQLEDAEKELALVEARAPQNARLWYLLGIIDLYRGDCKRAEQSLTKAEQLNPKFKGEAEYYLGVCYKMQGKSISARRYFEKAVKVAPETRWAERSEKELVKLPKIKPFSASTDVTYQYDSNIVPVPDKDSLPEDVSHMDDSRAVVWLDLGYAPLIKDKGRLGINYKFYNNWQFQEPELNLQIHQGQVNGYYDFNISKLGARLYSYYLYQLAGNGKDYSYYSTTHRVNTRFYLMETDNLATEISYTFEYEFFAHPGEEDFNRNNYANEIILGEHFYLWNGNIDLGIFGKYRIEDAEGKNYDLNNYGGKLFVQLVEWKKLSGWFSFTYDYKDFYRSDFDREDEVYSVALEVEYDFLKYLGVVFGANYSNYNSTVENYDYERQIYTLGIRAKY